MNGRAYDPGEFTSVTEKSTPDVSSPAYSAEDGRYNTATPRTVEDERTARRLCDERFARLRNARDAATRACRDIYQRYDWVSLEKSICEQLQSFETLSSDTPDRAVFEGYEPSSGPVELVVWAG